MNDRPLVSICVPTFNSSAYLRQSLDSIVSQTYGVHEVIIADNASTDDSAAIAHEYAEKYGFRVVLHEKNCGPLNNWNRLVDLATGDLVAIYHSDDVYEPAIVEESVQVFEKNAKVAIVGTMAHVIDAAGNRLFDYRLPDDIVKCGKKSYSFDDVMLGTFKSGGEKTFLITPSLMVRKSAYDEVGAFDAAFGPAGDYEMWLRVALKHEVAVLQKELINYRVHAAQGSEQELRKNVELPYILPVIRAYRQYITQNHIKTLCDTFIDERILKTALKQNWQGLFARSAATARLTETGSYLILKALLRVANGLHIKLLL